MGAESKGISRFPGGEFWNPWTSSVARFALVFGVLLHLMGFFVFRLTSDFNFETPASPAYITILDPAAGDWNAESVMFDSEPLFLQTTWNAQPERFPDYQGLVENSPFTNFAPRVALEQTNLDDFARVEQAPFVLQRPSDSLLLDEGNVFTGLASDDSFGYELESRSAVLSISSLQGGQRTVSRSIQSDELPLSNERLWQKCRFHLLIDIRGLIGQMFLVESSGQEDVDRLVQYYLLNANALGDLSPGYYSIVVSP